MGRIPDEELERIKRAVAVANLARRRGVELAPHGKDLIGLCPFHNDHNPSLVITPDKNLWHCFGACQDPKGGSVIDWVRKAEGVSFRQAVELLRRHDVALTPATARPVVKVGTVKKLPCPIPIGASDQTALRCAVDFYVETLKDSPEALAYLERRRIGHAGAIDHFKLGYSNRTFGYYLADSNRDEGAKIRGQLQRLGVYSVKGHERFNGSIVIPVMDENGSITEMYGRKIRDDLRDGTAYHLYLPGPHKGVWNVSSLAASKEAILCEALIDALTFWCAGFRNVTASYGVEGFTADHLHALRMSEVEKVLIAYDRDEAGDRAATKLAAILMGYGFEVSRVNFPDGEDANSFACSVSDPADALGVLLRGAAWIGRGKSSIVDMPVAAKEKISPPSAAEESPGEKSLTPAAPDPADVGDIGTCGAGGADPAAADLHECAPLEAHARPEAAAIPSGNGHQLDEVFDGRAWRIRGIEKNTTYGVLRVSVRVSIGDRFHLDTVDLANARHRAAFLKAASTETSLSEDMLKDDLRRLLLKLEELQDNLIQKAINPPDATVTLTEAEKEEALAFLRAPDLLDQIVKDFESIGIVGEEVNALTGYLACVSRKFKDPLAIIIQSASAAGKTTLMDAILSLMPKEEREQFSAVTGQALFYMGEKNLKHKILAIVEEKGAENATYAIKLLQSEGKLVIASTGKDPTTGKHVAFESRVEGPVVIIITTTNYEIDEELLNRVLVITINEDREQTERIHELQRERETLEGVLRQERRDDILRRHQNAQRLLRPIRVVNRYAKQLKFLSTQLRTRRDHPKYLTLIRSIALLHQYQRPVKQTQDGPRVISYIEVMPKDIEGANRIANVVLGRSLDELQPQTRRLLTLLDDMVTAKTNGGKITRAAFRFGRRDVREFTGWSDTPLKIHMARLVEMEFLILHRGRGQSFVYELIYDGQGKDGAPFCMGLIDPATLEQPYDGDRSWQNADRSGSEGSRSGSGPGAVRPRSGGGPGVDSSATPTTPTASNALLKNRAKTHIKEKDAKRPKTAS